MEQMPNAKMKEILQIITKENLKKALETTGNTLDQQVSSRYSSSEYSDCKSIYDFVKSIIVELINMHQLDLNYRICGFTGDRNDFYTMVKICCGGDTIHVVLETKIECTFEELLDIIESQFKKIFNRNTKVNISFHGSVRLDQLDKDITPEIEEKIVKLYNQLNGDSLSKILVNELLKMVISEETNVNSPEGKNISDIERIPLEDMIAMLEEFEEYEKHNKVLPHWISKKYYENSQYKEGPFVDFRDDVTFYAEKKLNMSVRYLLKKTPYLYIK